MLDWHLMSEEMLVQPRWQEMRGFVARENCSGCWSGTLGVEAEMSIRSI